MPLWTVMPPRGRREMQRRGRRPWASYEAAWWSIMVCHGLKEACFEFLMKLTTNQMEAVL